MIGMTLWVSIIGLGAATASSSAARAYMLPAGRPNASMLGIGLEAAHAAAATPSVATPPKACGKGKKNRRGAQERGRGAQKREAKKREERKKKNKVYDVVIGIANVSLKSKGECTLPAISAGKRHTPQWSPSQLNAGGVALLKECSPASRC